MGQAQRRAPEPLASGRLPLHDPVPPQPTTCPNRPPRPFVTEIPDHLLDRTRSRRQALGLPVTGDGGGGAASGTGVPAPAAAAGGAVSPANLPKGPVAPSGPSKAAVPALKAPAPFVEAARRRQRIPVWAMPVVAMLPLWAFLYAGTLEPPKSTNLTLLQAGAVVYSGAAACSACHGAGGAGGVGPQLSAGTVIRTFPDPVDQVRWVILGSKGGADLYNAAGKQSKGGMPAFGTEKLLTLKQIVEVVLHERKTLSGHATEEDAEAWAGLRALVEEFPDLHYTKEQVELILEEIAKQESVEIPEA